MLAVGKILKPHGIKGFVKAESFMDGPALLCRIKTLYVGGEYAVEKASVSGNFVLLKLKGVDSMDAAEKLRGMQLFAKKSDLPKPDEGRYYIDDLLKSDVADEDGKFIGVLYEILQHGSADVYVVKNNGATVMFPLIDGVVESFDTENKKITVNRAEFDKVAVYED